jgi:hypothetical protein
VDPMRHSFIQFFSILFFILTILEILGFGIKGSDVLFGRIESQCVAVQQFDFAVVIIAWCSTIGLISFSWCIMDGIEHRYISICDKYVKYFTLIYLTIMQIARIGVVSWGIYIYQHEMCSSTQDNDNDIIVMFYTGFIYYLIHLGCVVLFLLYLVMKHFIFSKNGE